MKNTVYYSDNLRSLREHAPDESIDLIHLDSPFKSDQDYNILFKERNRTRSAAQIRAFGHARFSATSILTTQNLFDGKRVKRSKELLAMVGRTFRRARSYREEKGE